MISCPDCAREHPEGTRKCSPGCGAWLRSNARTAERGQQQGLGLPYQRPERLADVLAILSKPKDPPSKDWARKLLADPLAQREVAPIAVEYAKRALQDRTGLRERQAGEDWDEDFAW